jgi:hypothetical protein
MSAPVLITDDESIVCDEAMSDAVSFRRRQQQDGHLDESFHSPAPDQKPPVQAIPIEIAPFCHDDEDEDEDEGNDQQSEILEALLSMKQFPQEAVQERACYALWIASFDDDNARALGRIGGIAPILDAMLLFPHNANIQQSCCEIIQNLSISASNRHVMIQQGGAALVVRAMMLHLNNVALQKSALSALANLSQSKRHHEDIIGAGAGHAVIHAARSCVSDPVLQSLASAAIQALGESSPKQYLP